MKMRCFKLTADAVAGLAQIDANLSKAIRSAALAWDKAGRPALLAVDDTNAERFTQRHDAATWAVVTAAGDGNASAGVRRLAAWMQAQTTEAGQIFGESDDGWGAEPVLADEMLLARDWEAGR